MIIEKAILKKFKSRRDDIKSISLLQSKQNGKESAAGSFAKFTAHRFKKRLLQTNQLNLNLKIKRFEIAYSHYSIYKNPS